MSARRADAHVVRTSSVRGTHELAEVLAEIVRPGDLVLLAGDLGAGKTAFVQGFGAALGVTERITSPTFTLAQVYEGKLPVHHLDVYRLDQIGEVAELGLGELLDDGGVVLIEWGDAILPALPNDYLEVRLTFGPGDDDREIDVSGVGPSWALRRRALATAVAALVGPAADEAPVRSADPASASPDQAPTGADRAPAPGPASSDPAPAEPTSAGSDRPATSEPTSAGSDRPAGSGPTSAGSDRPAGSGPVPGGSGPLPADPFVDGGADEGPGASGANGAGGPGGADPSGGGA